MCGRREYQVPESEAKARIAIFDTPDYCRECPRLGKESGGITSPGPGRERGQEAESGLKWSRVIWVVWSMFWPGHGSPECRGRNGTWWALSAAWCRAWPFTLAMPCHGRLVRGFVLKSRMDGREVMMPCSPCPCHSDPPQVTPPLSICGE
jgi:hypothetical protein